MNSQMKSFSARKSALHFLRETVVGSMEGTLFFLLSVLFTLAGAAALLEDFAPIGGAEMTAAATPSTPVAHALQQIATMSESFTRTTSSAASR